MELTRHLRVALAQARKSKTNIDVRDADNAGDVFMSLRPNEDAEAGVYMSREDARQLATALLAAANAGEGR